MFVAILLASLGDLGRLRLVSPTISRRSQKHRAEVATPSSFQYFA